MKYVNPLITIVIPVYKVPYDLLHKCLQSIAEQTSRNFEAICIDDGSPDDCGVICDKFAADKPYMRVIHQKNGGLSVVRNNGIKQARGEWVCFVDGDDWIESHTIAFAEQYIKDCPDGDILIWDEYYDVEECVKENCFLKDYESGINKFSGKRKKYLIDMFFPVTFNHFDNNFVDIGTANARLYRRQFLLENKIENVPGLRRMQDNVFNLWAIEKAINIYYQCERLYHYTFNSEAATQKYSPTNVDTMFFLYKCYEEYIKVNHPDDEEYRQRLYSRFIRIFGEIFKLNFSNPQNPNSYWKRAKDAKTTFANPDFKVVIDNFDSSKQGRKIKFIHSLFRHKLYSILILYYSLSIRSRKLRLQLKTK